MEDTTVRVRVTGLMFSAGHGNAQHATAKERVRKSKWKRRGGERESGGDGGHSVDKAVLFLIYVLL